jgi:hypothetical protein
VESRLWDAHLKVNNRFRKQLLRVSTPPKPFCKCGFTDCACVSISFAKSTARKNQLRGGNSNAITSTSSSQASGFTEDTFSICRRALEGLLSWRELRASSILRVGRRHKLRAGFLDTDLILSLDLSGQSPIKPSNDLRRLILQSCHATLIRLGDLSRYRESELVSKDRNWGPAIGYYDLASVINPASGGNYRSR